MTAKKGIDHLVHAVADLEAARATYGRLGFTLTPPADHPWGTRNSLAQLDGNFIELLEVVDPGSMEEASFDAFSFGAFNRDFLVRGEGLSMLVLDSEDAEADRAAFLARGLRVYAPFSFKRQAGQPDGSTATVAFDLTFTTHPSLPDVAFFTCRNRFPGHFWKADYQRHANGARQISGAVLVAPEPAELHEFVEGFTGQRELRATSFGLDCRLARGVFDVMTPAGFTALFGECYPLGKLESPRLVAMRLAVNDLDGFEASARAAGFSPERRSGAVLIPAAELHGSTLIAEAAM